MKPLILFCISWLLISSVVFSYDNLTVHPLLTEQAIKIYENYSKRYLTDEQIKLIIQGAINEDALPRPLNHFYDPSTGLGLSGKHISARDWAVNGGWVGATGDFSEKAILENYKNGNLERAYGGIGHIMHLIEDMSVPAHTRDDSHADGDIYETWAEINGKPNFRNVNLIKVNDLNVAFMDLASFTHDNFISRDTVDSKFLKDVENIRKENDVYYYIRNNYRLSLVNTKGLVPFLYFENDSKINQDYWDQLSPRAIGYAAGIIDYFENKFDEIDRSKEGDSKIGVFQKTKKEIVALWRGFNYLTGDVLSTFDTGRQEGWKQTSQFAKSAKDVAVEIKKKTEKNINDAVNVGVDVADKAIKNTKVLGEKISNNTKASAEVKVSKAGNNLKQKIQAITKTGNLPKPGFVTTPIKVITIDPAKADNFINPDLLPAIKTTLPPIYTGERKSANNKPVSLPEPIVYPKIFLINKPAKHSSSSVAEFAFESDQASSSFEYMLDSQASSSDWISASSSLFLENLSDGLHSLKVRATNKGFANTNPDIYDWSIDTSAPTSKINAVLVDNETVDISWSLLDNEDDVSYGLDYRFNGDDWLNLLTATNSTSSTFAKSFSNGDIAEFRLVACDAIGNCEKSGENNIAKVQRMPGHLLISALQISGATIKDEWIELYNPTASDVSLKDYKIKRKNSSGGIDNVASDFGDATIRSHGYYLVAHPTEYDGREPADLLYAVSNTITDDNSVFLLDGTTTVDKVGYGMARDFEGTAAYSPQANEILVRKSDYSGYEAWKGNARDTDNNLYDFIKSTDYRVHSSDSATEPSIGFALPATPVMSLADAGLDNALLNWQNSFENYFGSGTKYELKYFATSSGKCKMNLAWRNSNTVEGMPEPSNDSLQSFQLSGLLAGTEYCAGVRAFNGIGWSQVSENFTFHTMCADLLPRLPNYFIHYATASAATVPGHEPENVVVIDFVNDPAAAYDFYGPIGCSLIAKNAEYPGDLAATVDRIEIVYDPQTMTFTGEHRFCHNGNHYYHPLSGDHCLDRVVEGNGSRWIYSPTLKGQNAISLKRNDLNEGQYKNYFTEWIVLK